MKPYHLMNTQEMAEAQRTDPVGYKAMVDALDNAPQPIDADRQWKWRNGQRIGNIPTPVVPQS